MLVHCHGGIGSSGSSVTLAPCCCSFSTPIQSSTKAEGSRQTMTTSGMRAARNRSVHGSRVLVARSEHGSRVL
jgi:hypothetical protein